MWIFYITNGKLSIRILPFVLPCFSKKPVNKGFHVKKLSKNIFPIDTKGKFGYTFGKFSDSYKNEFEQRKQ